MNNREKEEKSMKQKWKIMKNNEANNGKTMKNAEQNGKTMKNNETKRKTEETTMKKTMKIMKK